MTPFQPGHDRGSQWQLAYQAEIRQGLPFEVSTKSRPLFTSDEQAAAWTEAFGAY